MSTIDKAMLRECLLKSTLNDIKIVEKSCNTDTKASFEFKEKIKQIINSRKKNSKTTPKKILVIAVAAILLSLSIMFSISAKMRNWVVDTFRSFFVEEHEEYSVLTPVKQEENKVSYPTTIEKKYIPKYVIDNNYEEFYKDDGEYSSLTSWTNGSVYIDLSQHVVDENNIIVDTENTEYQAVTINSKEVFVILKNNIYTIAWVEYGYSFNLSCDEILGWEEIEKIILSIGPVE